MKDPGRLLLFFVFLLLFSPAAPAQKLTLQEVISLKKMGFTEGEVVRAIRKSGLAFTLDEEARKKLREAGFRPSFFEALAAFAPSRPPGEEGSALLALVQRKAPVEEILRRMAALPGDHLARLRAPLEKAGAPQAVLLAARGKPLTVKDLEDLAAAGTPKGAYALLAEMLGVRKEAIPPGKALDLARRGVPPGVIKRFRAGSSPGGEAGVEEGSPRRSALEALQSLVVKEGEYSHLGKRFVLRCPPGWRLIRGIDDGDVFYALTPRRRGDDPDSLDVLLELSLVPFPEDARSWGRGPADVLEKLLPSILLSEPGLELTGKVEETLVGGLEGAVVPFRGTFKNRKGEYLGVAALALEGDLAYLVEATASKELFPLYGGDFLSILERSRFGRPAPSTRGPDRDPSELVRKYKGSVVVVNASTDLEGSQGTGFIVSRDGYILTNWHVVWDARRNRPYREFTVSWDDSLKRPSKKARLVGWVHKVSRQVRVGGIDLALLEIDPGDYTPIPLTRLKDVELGDGVIAMGFPRSDLVSGYSIFITKGVVVRFNRDLSGRVEAVATDAKITHGNSGGPCLSLKTGGALGLNTWGFDIDPAAGDLNDMVGYYFVCPAEAAMREFPLAVDLGIPADRKLSFLDYYELSRIYSVLGSPRAALRLAEKALREKPDSAYALAQKAQCLAASAVEELQEDPAKALASAKEAAAVFKKALDIRPDYEDALTTLTDLLLELEEPADAARYARKCVRLFPRDWEGHFLLAKALLALKKKDEGERELRKAMDLSRNLVGDPWILAGNLAYARGDYEKGREYFRKAARIRPGDLTARMGVVEYLELEKRWNEAASAYRGLLAEFPGNPLLFFRIGVCLRNEGKAGEALKAYGKALSEFRKRGFPPPADLLLDVADIFLKEKKKPAMGARFLSMFLLYYGNEREALDVHLKLAGILERPGAAAAHVRRAAALAEKLGVKDFHPPRDLPDMDLSLEDIHYLLSLGYPPSVAADLILHTALTFAPRTKADVEALVKKEKLPLVVVKAILAAARKGRGAGAGGPARRGGRVSLVGRWRASIFIPNAGRYTEVDEFTPDGRFTTLAELNGRTMRYSGTYRVEGDEIVFTKDTGGGYRETFRVVGPGHIQVYQPKIDQWVDFRKE